MDIANLTAQMASTAEAIRALTQDVSADAASWQPHGDAWSLLDVVKHLVYEEEHDFRAALHLVLHHPQDALPPGDPARGVTEDGRRQGLERARDAFMTARQESLAWLKGLETPDWDAAYEAPFGQITAGDLLAAWVAHDLLHLRQLIELRYHYLAQQVRPYGVRYAGRWEWEPDPE